ncbi:MAG: nuclear transport factor 2 family protein [Lentimicrobiaceae bacterium]|jgi:uncharacterized protein (TIGR02246 family)
MKNTLFVTFAIILLSFSACNSTPKPEASLTNTDSLMTQWNDAWNASDGDKVADIFADNAILVANNITIGKDSIKVKFIQRSIKGLKNLKTKKVYEYVSTDFATQTGTYTHDWVKNDSTTETASGIYTFDWMKQADKSWKLVLVHM